MRVIVGGVGYPDLCDYSIGIEIQERLSLWDAPTDVVVEDLSYNPIAIKQRFDDEAANQKFDRVIMVSAVKRGDRPPGTVTSYRWNEVMPDETEIQRMVTDAVTGIIAVENTIVITRYFGGLPDDVVVVEIEPETHEFGAAFSKPVMDVFDDACAHVWQLATDDAAAASLQLGSIANAIIPSIWVG